MNFSKNAVFLLSLLMLLSQGCVYWMPMDVDYDIEIELNEHRPNINSDIGFIHYACTERASGYHFYMPGLKNNRLDKVFLLSQKLYDIHRDRYISECDVVYPSDLEIDSFQNVDLDPFKASVEKCFNSRYRLKSVSGHRQYGRENAGYALSADSCEFDIEHTEEDTNIAMEHSLQALLLRTRYPHCPALHEKQVFIKKLMLQTNPQFPITTLQRLTSGVRYELLTDNGICAGSVTVRYPSYIWLTDIDCGADEAKCAAMSYFLTMFCDLSKCGRYKGTITSFIPFLARRKPIATIKRFKKIF